MNADDIRWTTWEAFKSARHSLSVNLIATPHDDLATCGPGELIAAVREQYSQYDYVPVRQGGDIIGLLHLADGERSAAADEESVEEHAKPLSDDHLIGADASIVQYTRDVRDRPFRFVVSGTGISGFVTWSDLQQLPARAALFSLITGLETAMSKWIERRFHSDEEWLALLSCSRRQGVRDRLAAAKGSNSEMKPVLYTEFCDKVTVLRRGGFSKATRSRGDLKRTLKRIQDLRDAVAHANNYASSFEAACEVCDNTKSIEDIWKIIDGEIERGGRVPPDAGAPESVSSTPCDSPISRERVLEEVRRRYDRRVMSNLHRSEYVEALVTVALECRGWTRKNPWEGWTLEHASGIRLQVKQSAAAQSWGTGASKSTPQYNIAPRTGCWDEEEARWVPERGHLADIYVFAWHEENALVADQRDPSSWEFRVVARDELPPQKTIGLRPLRGLSSPCRIDALADAVDSICGSDL